MTLHRWLLPLAGALVFTGLLGCEPPPPPPPPPAIVIPPVLSLSEYKQMKAAYLKANPDASVGRVVAVLTSDSRLAAGDLKTKDFAPGDVVNIVDRDMNVIADGTVARVDPDLLFIKYAPPVNGGGRDPLVGDILIRPGKPTNR